MGPYGFHDQSKMGWPRYRKGRVWHFFVFGFISRERSPTKGISIIKNNRSQMTQQMMKAFSLVFLFWVIIPIIALTIGYAFAQGSPWTTKASMSAARGAPAVGVVNGVHP